MPELHSLLKLPSPCSSFSACLRSHCSFCSMLHSQAFFRSRSSPASAASAFRRSVCASLRCFSSRCSSFAVTLDFWWSSTRSFRFAAVDAFCACQLAHSSSLLQWVSPCASAARAAWPAVPRATVCASPPRLRDRPPSRPRPLPRPPRRVRRPPRRAPRPSPRRSPAREARCSRRSLRTPRYEPEEPAPAKGSARPTSHRVSLVSAWRRQRMTGRVKRSER